MVVPVVDMFILCESSHDATLWRVKRDQLQVKRSNMQKHFAHYVKSSKITIFPAGPGAAIFTLAKCLSHQVQLRD